MNKLKRVVFFIIFVSIIALFLFLGERTPQDFSQGQDAIQGFFASAFSSEYGDESRDFLLRWETPLTIRLYGTYTQDDFSHLQAFLSLLQEKVPTLPFLSLVEEEENVSMHFVPAEQMSSIVPSYQRGNQGFFSYEYEDFAIIKGTVVIDSTLIAQETRNRVVEEELINLLGLTNDIFFLPNSLLYTGFPSPVSATPLDYAMLNLLYHPNIQPGITKEKAEKILSP